MRELTEYPAKQPSWIQNGCVIGKSFQTFLWPACLIVALALWPVKAYSEELPSGEEVTSRSIEAMGGKAAFDAIHTRVARGRVVMPSYGIKGTITTYQSRPDRFLFITDLGRAGSATRGYDGETLWEVSSNAGPRIFEGTEKATLILVYRFDRTDFKRHFETIETVGIEEIDDEECYKVVATPKTEAKPITIYYSIESGLPVRSDFTMNGPHGEIVVKNYHHDYRKVGQVLLPHSGVQDAVGLVSKTVYESITLNEDVGEDRYELPDEIEDLK